MSYEFKGTPGPWDVGFGGGLGGDVISWTCFLDQEGCIQLPVRSGGEAVCIIPHENSPERHLRDARAISATPELIKELAHVVGIADAAANGEDVEDEEDFLAWLERARTALAKATGEHQ